MMSGFRHVAVLCLLLGGSLACSHNERPPCYLVSGKQAKAMLEPGTILLDVRTREQQKIGRVRESVLNRGRNLRRTQPVHLQQILLHAVVSGERIR